MTTDAAVATRRARSSTFFVPLSSSEVITSWLLTPPVGINSTTTRSMRVWRLVVRSEINLFRRSVIKLQITTFCETQSSALEFEF